jgi:transcriptional regulator with XRE-family HTH domain
MTTHAIAAFREALRHEGITQEEYLRRAGISRPALAKFASGRSPSSYVLPKLVQFWSDKQDGVNVLLGHLRDQIVAAGKNPDDFNLKAKNPLDFLGSEVVRMVSSDSARSASLLTLLQEWAHPIESESKKQPETPNTGAKQGSELRSAKKLEGGRHIHPSLLK